MSNLFPFPELGRSYTVNISSLTRQMIDREKRQIAALALRRFLDCQIDNLDYENEYAGLTGETIFQFLFGKRRDEDRALRAISDFTWCWYDDFHSHTLDGDHALSEEARTIGERCLVFLYSETEYEWRTTSLLMTESAFSPGSVTTLNLGVGVPLTLTQHLSALLSQPEGDISFWPFFRRSDYELAASQYRSEPQSR